MGTRQLEGSTGDPRTTQYSERWERPCRNSKDSTRVSMLSFHIGYLGFHSLTRCYTVVSGPQSVLYCSCSYICFQYYIRMLYVSGERSDAWIADRWFFVPHRGRRPWSPSRSGIGQFRLGRRPGANRGGGLPVGVGSSTPFERSASSPGRGSSVASHVPWPTDRINAAGRSVRFAGFYSRSLGKPLFRRPSMQLISSGSLEHEGRTPC